MGFGILLGLAVAIILPALATRGYGWRGLWFGLAVPAALMVLITQSGYSASDLAPYAPDVRVRMVQLSDILLPLSRSHTGMLHCWLHLPPGTSPRRACADDSAANLVRALRQLCRRERRVLSDLRRGAQRAREMNPKNVPASFCLCGAVIRDARAAFCQACGRPLAARDASAAPAKSSMPRKWLIALLASAALCLISIGSLWIRAPAPAAQSSQVPGISFPHVCDLAMERLKADGDVTKVSGSKVWVGSDFYSLGFEDKQWMAKTILDCVRVKDPDAGMIVFIDPKSGNLLGEYDLNWGLHEEPPGGINSRKH